VERVDRALQMLGFDMLRALVIAQEIGHAFPTRLASWSPDEAMRHAIRTAYAARAMGDGEPERAALFTAGLLHDVGKLVLASQAPDRLDAVLREAAERGVPAHEAERSEWGTTHAEVGAYLLGLWGLPWSIVEAVALHHAPAEWQHASTPLAASIAFAQYILHHTRTGDDATSLIEEEAFAGLGDVEARRALAARIRSSVPEGSNG
jgi:HD-like signal output (HDOD) protein